jgi:molecular chaperone DnaK (HSP70)
MKGFGVDFGTTNSIAAFYDHKIKKVQPLLSSEMSPHPSIVWYKADGAIIVGHDAKKNIMGFSNVEGNEFVSSIKRRLGKGHSLSIFGQKKSVSEVATEIFRHLKKHAQEDNVQLNNVIVTVPVYFNGQQRRELRKADDDAGLYIKTFIHEPFAAIVGYCYREGSGISLDGMQNQLILVFDWGGGTLDITLVQVLDGELRELATSGLEDKAGDYFDEKLSRFAKSSFIDYLQARPNEINPSPGNIGRLLTECERAKKNLSEIENETIQVAQFCRYDGSYHHLKQPVLRNDFENLINNDIKDAIAEVNKALDTANVRSNEIDVAILIGGSSRIPLIKESLRKMFGYRIVEMKNADTIIAEGAAIIDALNLQPIMARDLCAELSDGTDFEIFKSGVFASPETCKKKVHFYCTDNRDGVAKLVIKEHTGRIHATRPLTKNVLSIPVSSELPKPYNHERVIVDFALDRDMVLHVSGKGATQNQNAKCEIFDLCFGLSIFGANL